LIAIPFFISLGRILQQQENGNEKLKKRTVIISIIACLSLSLIGCFPAINLIMLLIHGIFAIIFFFAGLFFCLFFGYLMLKDSRFSEPQSYLGFIGVGIFTIYLCTIKPLLEWIVVIFVFFWIIENAIYVIHKKL